VTTNPNVSIVAIEVQERDDPDPDTDYLYQDADQGYDKRLREYHQGLWHYVGVIAVAKLHVSTASDGGWINQEVSSAGLWGVESDSDGDHFKQIAQDEIEQLHEITDAMGIAWDDSLVPDQYKGATV